ncbi:S-adenosyl-L-methionine-dependent methyltransferase [Cylindrobasidium torrendii FP15055 ss-10]|uniref:S-adenosyl-L-methionine-dependent methyltransferase n=1 Tax=Cylindrobasidium torrendii FP15055 ss-10 TaxID=1314674 RepID=A0A0D7AU20_9AGAR|nr:S-adenosyl-L-methionine-dependent methyltransferase [Cylindrobasidium torrendii FP15055 ss-10]
MSSSETVDASGWSAKVYNDNASFVYSAKFTSAVVGLLAPKPGEKIIDFGCGSGEVTREIEAVVKQADGGFVFGVDASESMISRAKECGLQRAFVADIQEPLQIAEIGETKFDAVFTNATLHWCKHNPAGVLDNARNLLKPGGRLVGEMGGFMNCVGIRSVLHKVLKQRGHDAEGLDPWFFPSVEDYTKLLEAASFEPIEVVLVPRFTPLPTGLIGWLRTFVRSSFLRALSDEEAESIMQEVADIMSVDCRDSQGNKAMMYMRLRFSALKKS